MDEQANGLRYLRVGGVGNSSDADNAGACKMLVEAAESHTSGARFVRLRVSKDTFAFHALLKKLPFHLINFVFCNSCFNIFN